MYQQQLPMEWINKIGQTAMNLFGRELLRRGVAQFRVDQTLNGFSSTQARLNEFADRINSTFYRVKQGSLSNSDQEVAHQTAQLVAEGLLNEYLDYEDKQRSQFQTSVGQPVNNNAGGEYSVQRYTLSADGTGTSTDTGIPTTTTEQTAPVKSEMFIGITSVQEAKDMPPMSTLPTPGLEHASTHQYQLNDDLTLHIHNFKTEQKFETFTDAIRTLYETMTRRHLNSPDFWGFTMQYRKLTSLDIPYEKWATVLREIEQEAAPYRVMPSPDDLSYIAKKNLSASEYDHFSSFIGTRASKYFPILVSGFTSKPIESVDTLEDLVQLEERFTTVEHKAFIETVWDNLWNFLKELDYVQTESEFEQAGIVTDGVHEGDVETVIKETVSSKTVFWESVNVTISNVTNGQPPKSLKQYGMGEGSHKVHREITKMITVDAYVPVRRQCDLVDQNLTIWMPKIASAASRIEGDAIMSHRIGIFGWV